jgi:hypothetical protein
MQAVSNNHVLTIAIATFVLFAIRGTSGELYINKNNSNDINNFRTEM